MRAWKERGRCSGGRFVVRILGAATVLVAAAIAQVPASHNPPDRRVHPGIAPPAPGLLPQPAPMLAMPDGKWNHGEGFGSSGSDNGGWHGPTDGTNVTLSDVHVDSSDVWVPFAWASPLYTSGYVSMQRMEGYLAPASHQLPDRHPLYGQLTSQYVDQGAFEMFKPTTNWNPAWLGQKRILLVVHTQETVPFPVNRNGKRLEWRQMYRGFFSADGLVRNEPPGGHSPTSFLNTDNLDGADVERPRLNTIANWDVGKNYWPIEAYPVLTLMHRSTTLNEQRCLQLVKAVKELLRSAGDARNPLGASNALTAQQVEDNVLVVFVGGSNGGMQSSLAALRFPHLVHGCYASVINPSYQRLYGEFDLGHALARLSGEGMGPREVTEDDFLSWNQYVWSQDLEMHDMSYLRRFFSGRAYRPCCFAVGDEDITSTGVDWARVIAGSAWSSFGVVPSPLPFASATGHTFGWMVADYACHQSNVAPVTNPYTGQANQWHGYDVALDFYPSVRTQRDAQIAQAVHPPVPALLHEERALHPNQSFRGPDDPQEWWLGRLGDPLPVTTVNDPLRLDTAFVDAVNWEATGNMPAGKEAIFVRDGRVYVGSVDGFVTSFFVPPAATNPKQPLLRHAQSPRLGHECFAIAPVVSGSTWWLVAGTRRHLHRLDSNSLAKQSSVELPWEVAQPHHMKVADVLPGHTGPEIVFASTHGGLCFYDLALQPVHEWPEPGILDFFVEGGAVTILSARGVLATVSFSGPTHAPTLLAVSNPIPGRLREWNGANDPPSQGRPSDLERMRVNWTGYGAGFHTAAISSWLGDEDGNAVRGHWVPTLQAQPFLSGLAESIVDIATCTQSNPPPAGGDAVIGDHALVLQSGNRLQLYNELGGLVGGKVLTEVPVSIAPYANGYYPFGDDAYCLAVGEMAANTGSYSEEVVVATGSGLMWLHIEELLSSGTSLPAVGDSQGRYVSGFWVETERTMTAAPASGTGGSRVQARTNAAMQSTWPMARRPGNSTLDEDLHVLDQRGCYWKVSPAGTVRLWETSIFSRGARGWDYVGPVGVPVPTDPLPLSRQVGTLGPYGQVTTKPFCPKDTENLVYELSGGSTPFIANNWDERPVPQYLLDGFVVHDVGGAVVQKPNGSGLWTTDAGYEVWRWTAAPAVTINGVDFGDWGNLVQAWHAQSSGAIDAIWASTHRPDATTRCPHHRLRSYVTNVSLLTQQSIRAVDLQVGANYRQTAVVLGCPGGRVRVLLPGTMREADAGFHDLGVLKTSDDFGLGGSALAVKVDIEEANEVLRIWFGTIEQPTLRPGTYGSPGAWLTDPEVAAGAIHTMTFTPGQGFSAVATPVKMQPGPHPRGASGVTGMLLTELFASSPGDELVVATLSGDLFVYAAGSMVQLWRSHVHGAVGCFNAIRAEDLDGDGLKELYVAGSVGLWRFLQPGE